MPGRSWSSDTGIIEELLVAIQRQTGVVLGHRVLLAVARVGVLRDHEEISCRRGPPARPHRRPRAACRRTPAPPSSRHRTRRHRTISAGRLQRLIVGALRQELKLHRDFALLVEGLDLVLDGLDLALLALLGPHLDGPGGRTDVGTCPGIPLGAASTAAHRRARLPRAPLPRPRLRTEPSCCCPLLLPVFVRTRPPGRPRRADAEEPTPALLSFPSPRPDLWDRSH